MLIPGKEINVFDKNPQRVEGSWFTGKMNTQELDFDPLVVGYSFIIWEKIPFWVEKAWPNFKSFTQRNFKAFDGLTSIELQTQQYQHTFNGNNYEYAATIQKQNTNFSIRHQEFSGNPVKNMYQFWVSGIRDPETDIAVYPRAYNCTYGAKNHTGQLLYVVTRPDANNVNNHNIEFAAFYTAVMPLTIPLQHLGFSLSDHTSPEIDINFVGDLHIGPEVDNYAATKLKEAYPILTAADFDPAQPNKAGKSDNLGSWDGEAKNVTNGLESFNMPAALANSGENS